MTKSSDGSCLDGGCGGVGELIWIYVEERSRVQGRLYHCPKE